MMINAALGQVDRLLTPRLDVARVHFFGDDPPPGREARMPVFDAAVPVPALPADVLRNIASKIESRRDLARFASAAPTLWDAAQENARMRELRGGRFVEEMLAVREQSRHETQRDKTFLEMADGLKLASASLSRERQERIAREASADFMHCWPFRSQRALAGVLLDASPSLTRRTFAWLARCDARPDWHQSEKHLARILGRHMAAISSRRRGELIASLRLSTDDRQVVVGIKGLAKGAASLSAAQQIELIDAMSALDLGSKGDAATKIAPYLASFQKAARNRYFDEITAFRGSSYYLEAVLKSCIASLAHFEPDEQERLVALVSHKFEGAPAGVELYAGLKASLAQVDDEVRRRILDELTQHSPEVIARVLARGLGDSLRYLTSHETTQLRNAALVDASAEIQYDVERMFLECRFPKARRIESPQLLQLKSEIHRMNLLEAECDDREAVPVLRAVAADYVLLDESVKAGLFDRIRRLQYSFDKRDVLDKLRPQLSALSDGEITKILGLIRSSDDYGRKNMLLAIGHDILRRDDLVQSEFLSIVLSCKSDKVYGQIIAAVHDVSAHASDADWQRFIRKIPPAQKDGWLPYLKHRAYRYIVCDTTLWVLAAQYAYAFGIRARDS